MATKKKSRAKPKPHSAESVMEAIRKAKKEFEAKTIKKGKKKSDPVEEALKATLDKLIIGDLTGVAFEEIRRTLGE